MKHGHEMKTQVDNPLLRSSFGRRPVGKTCPEKKEMICRHFSTLYFVAFMAFIAGSGAAAFLAFFITFWPLAC